MKMNFHTQDLCLRTNLQCFEKQAGAGNFFMKIQWKTLFICLLIPLAVGGISAFLTKDGMEAFSAANKPPLTPPNWLFPVVWTILFILMGIASYLVATSGKPSQAALTVYGLQLVFNFLWSIFFFNMQWYLFAFVWLFVLWFLILVTTMSFKQISKAAGYLMVPYLLWVTFAGYLNFGVYLVNR